VSSDLIELIRYDKQLGEPGRSGGNIYFPLLRGA
jgi:hypothetical protein